MAQEWDCDDMDRRGDRLWRAAGLCGERSNVPRDSAVLYGAGMMINDTFI